MIQDRYTYIVHITIFEFTHMLVNYKCIELCMCIVHYCITDSYKCKISGVNTHTYVATYVISYITGHINYAGRDTHRHTT